MKNDSDPILGMVGCGNMGEALIKGILASRLVAKDNLVGYDIRPERRGYIKEKFGIRLASSNPELIATSDIVILAVKPQQMDELLIEISRAFDPAHLIISIVAGVTTHHIESFIKAEVAVIRVMPNTPALIGAGISAISVGSHIKAKDKEVTRSIFQAVGEVVEVEEQLMDVVTAISGSGPAYFFYLIESLAKCGIEHGLREEVARKLANQTALGSARMVLETGVDPRALRERVTSKGGTTEAAFGVFDRAKLAEIYSEAVDAAIKRSQELSGG